MSEPCARAYLVLRLFGRGISFPIPDSFCRQTGLKAAVKVEEFRQDDYDEEYRYHKNPDRP